MFVYFSVYCYSIGHIRMSMCTSALRVCVVRRGSNAKPIINNETQSINLINEFEIILIYIILLPIFFTYTFIYVIYMVAC